MTYEYGLQCKIPPSHWVPILTLKQTLLVAYADYADMHRQWLAWLWPNSVCYWLGEMVAIGAPAEGDVVAEFYIGRVAEVYNWGGTLWAELHHFQGTIEKDAKGVRKSLQRQILLSGQCYVECGQD
ncbi:hypothetical protein BJ742DRAFT_740277 [Cladochytrium replicatum]|nr:hypothetical protein BJ742DRAFT_740277 [Cladochytrium replicatum]